MIDFENEFKRAMANSGIICNENIIADGKLHRFKNEGDHNPNSWYVLHDGSLPAGAYGCWKKDISEKWVGKPTNQLSPEEYKNYKAQIEKARILQEADRAKMHAESKKTAQQIWNNSVPATGNHQYLLDKKIKPNGARIDSGDLIIPIRNSNGGIESLQFIKPNGKKIFLTGGAISGNYCSIGKLTDIIYVCEGFATAATVHEATDCGSIVTFGANKLLAVAQIIRKKYPDKEIVIGADNDAFNGDDII
jgi:putative DNA primase/helicase